MPSANVMKLGDLITVVQDDGGCEFYYKKYMSDRVWVYPGCPANVRWLRKWAGYGIIWGFFGAGIIGSIAGYAQWESARLNMTMGVFIAITTASLVWSLIGRPPCGASAFEECEGACTE